MYLFGLRAPLPAQWQQPSSPTFPKISPQVTASTNPCPIGYAYAHGMCMSNGCIDGRSKCVVIDSAGQKCTYDALLAYQHSSGVASCPPPTVTVVQPQPSSNGGTPTVQPQPPDASVPGGGTATTPDGGIPMDDGSTLMPDGTVIMPDGTIVYPSAKKGLSKALLLLGGVLAGVTVIALLARKR